MINSSSAKYVNFHFTWNQHKYQQRKKNEDLEHRLILE